MLERIPEQNLFDPARRDVTSDDEPTITEPSPRPVRAPRPASSSAPPSSRAQYQSSGIGGWKPLVVERVLALRRSRTFRYVTVAFGVFVLLGRTVGCGRPSRSTSAVTVRRAPEPPHNKANPASSTPLATTSRAAGSVSRPAIPVRRVEHTGTCLSPRRRTARAAASGSASSARVARSLTAPVISSSATSAPVVVGPVAPFPSVRRALPEVGVEFSFEE
jgi:hypothetical protein